MSNEEEEYDSCHSRPVPDTVDESWIPNDLYWQAVKAHEDFHDRKKNLLEPTMCPSHVRNLQPLAKAPTKSWATDRMLPGFTAEHDYAIGSYVIGRVELRDKNGKWHPLALLANEGDADCNTGHWGGAFLIGKDKKLTPLVWIRSDGDTETYVKQAKTIDRDLLQSFNDLTELEYSSSAFDDSDEEEEEDEDDDDDEYKGLFGIRLNPGQCKTPLEKLVGVAYGHMMVEGHEHCVEIGDDDDGDDGDDDNDNKKEGPALADLVFAIGGSLSMKRADFVALIEENGGVVKMSTGGSLAEEVTHLISARSDTEKAKKARQNGVRVIKEEEVMDMISGTKAADDNEEEHEEVEEEEEEENNGQNLEGMVFAITGTLSMKRADFVALIEENGGVVKGSVTKDVTHLISAKDDTAKAIKARENGVEILKEEQVMEMVSGGGKEEEEEEEAEEEEEEEEAETPKKKAATKKRKATPSPSKKMGLGGFAAPDPSDGTVMDSGVAGLDAALASRARVHEEYHARLALVDAAVNSDKYYVLQVLVDENPPKKSRGNKKKSGPLHYLFTRWGRTGTGGQAKLDGPFEEEEDAQAAFEKIFKSKTGVAWSNAEPGQAPKKGKYEYLATGDAATEDAKWYYYLQDDLDGKPDGWYEYDEHNSQEVEDLHGTFLASNKAMRLSRRVVTSGSSGFQYRVDLSTMQQTNTSSGTTRPIGRTDNGEPPSGIPGEEEEEEEKKEEEEEEEEENDKDGPALADMVFAITGALSMKRADFVALIGEHGGVVKGSVTKDVTHLISARDDTAKALKAKENGVKILKEEQVMKLVGGTAEPAKKRAKR